MNTTTDSLPQPRIAIRIPANLRPLTGGADVIPVHGRTFSHAIAALEAAFPALRERLRSPNGQIRRTLLVFLNDDDIRDQEEEDVPLKDGDEISIVPALAGG